MDDMAGLNLGPTKARSAGYDATDSGFRRQPRTTFPVCKPSDTASGLVILCGAGAGFQYGARKDGTLGPG